MMYNTFIEFPEGGDMVYLFLKKFKRVKRKQLQIYLMQMDPTFNQKRAITLIEKMISLGILKEEKNDIFLDPEDKVNQGLNVALWYLLQNINGCDGFDLANYPAEIIYKKDDTVSEIIVCNDDFLEKMTYLSKRKEVCKTHYYVILTADTIKEIDDSTVPNLPLTIVTISVNQDVPKFITHEVVLSE